MGDSGLVGAREWNSKEHIYLEQRNQSLATLYCGCLVAYGEQVPFVR